jgi:hypothetical protein
MEGQQNKNQLYAAEQPVNQGSANQTQQYTMPFPAEAPANGFFDVIDKRMVLPLVVIIVLIIAAGIFFVFKYGSAGQESAPLVSDRGEPVSEGTAGSSEVYIAGIKEFLTVADLPAAWEFKSGGIIDESTLTGDAKGKELAKGLKGGIFRSFVFEQDAEFKKRSLEVMLIGYSSASGALTTLEEANTYMINQPQDVSTERFQTSGMIGDSSEAYIVKYDMYPLLNEESFNTANLFFVKGNFYSRVAISGYGVNIGDAEAVARIIEQRIK